MSCHSQQTRRQKHNNTHALIKYSIRNENESYIKLFFFEKQSEPRSLKIQKFLDDVPAKKLLSSILWKKRSSETSVWWLFRFITWKSCKLFQLLVVTPSYQNAPNYTRLIACFHNEFSFTIRAHSLSCYYFLDMQIVSCHIFKAPSCCFDVVDS